MLKYIHEHSVDKEGKDSSLFLKAGANYSIIRNTQQKTGIFLKSMNDLNKLIEWIKLGPFHVDILFTESFRDFEGPTILFFKDRDRYEEQDSKKVKALSGLYFQNPDPDLTGIKKPFLKLPEDFEKFLVLFELK